MTENTKITAALIKLQGDLKNIPMDSENTFFKGSKYASLLSVRETIQGPLAENKMAVTQTFRMEGERILLVTTLRHESGEWIESAYPIHPGTPQQQGSAITYARRYSLLALLNLVGDPDDDGEASEGRNTPVTPSRASQRGARPQVGGTKPKTPVEVAEGIAQTLGFDAMNDWYKSLTPAELKAVEPEKARLVKMAKDFDADRAHVKGE